MAAPQVITPQEHNSELRRPLYKDVEALLCPGFLSHPFVIGSTHCCMRTYSPGDLMLLRARTETFGGLRSWMEWAVASCTWMVNGQPLLEDHRATLKIREALQSMSFGAVKTLFSIFQGLYNRTGAVIIRLESYCYEPYSRGFWRMCGRQFPGRDDFTGIPGTSRLGHNSFQRLWIAYNLSEDDRLEEMSKWSAAKLVASAHAPKGIKKLNQADQRQFNSEQQRRQAVQDRMYWEVMGEADRANTMRVKRAASPTELVEDMRKWVAGDMDDHDRVVEEHKARIRNRFESEKRDREQRRQMLEAHQEMGHSGGTELVGYTLDDLSRITRDRPPGVRGQGARRVFEGDNPHRLYEKHLASDPSSGVLQAGEGGIVSGPRGRSLNEQIRDRKVTLKPGSDG